MVIQQQHVDGDWQYLTTGSVPIDRIRTDGGTQMRVRANDPEVEERYVEAMQAGTVFPPLVTFYDGGAFWLADGFRRLGASRRVGLDRVACDVRRGSLRDAVLYAISANEKHGVPRTNADRRRAVAALIADAEWSRCTVAEMAKLADVSEKLVRDVIAEHDAKRPPVLRVEGGAVVWSVGGMELSWKTADASALERAAQALTGATTANARNAAWDGLTRPAPAPKPVPPATPKPASKPSPKPTALPPEKAAQPAGLDSEDIIAMLTEMEVELRRQPDLATCRRYAQYAGQIRRYMLGLL